MDSELSLVCGIIAAALSLAALATGLADGRLSKIGVFLLLVGGGLIFWAYVENPEGYALADIPDAFIHVLARILN